MNSAEVTKSSPFGSSINLLAIIFLFMGIGTVVELWLLGHYEDSWQLTPMILLGISFFMFLLLHWNVWKVPILLFRLLMLACILSGLLGTWFHLNANMEFEAELHPNESMSKIFLDSLSGALPTLAPGSMIVFGLLGYMYTLLILKK